VTTKHSSFSALARDAAAHVSLTLDQLSRAWVRVVLVCAFLVSWRLSGALLVPLVLLLTYKLLVEYLWGQRRRKLLAQNALPDPGVAALYRQHRIHNRRIRTVRRQFPAACLDYRLAKGKGKDAITPLLHKVTTTVDLDVVAHFRSNGTGVMPEDIAKHADRIRRTVECKELLVTYTRDTTNAVLTFRWTEALGRVLPVADLPPSPKGRISYGIRRDGSAATVRWDLSILIGGLTRHGKSNVIWAMLADLLRKGVPVALYVSDPKAVEMRQFFGKDTGEKMGTLTVRRYANTPEATIEMVESAYGALEKRKREQVGKNWVIDERNPLTIVILDELLPLHEMIADKHKGALGKILYTGAASGFVVWANAQVGHADVLGILRNFIPQRICFATPTADTTNTFLGTGAEQRGAKCSEINEPGLCYAVTDDSRNVEMARAALVTDPDMAVIASGGVPAGMADDDKGPRNVQVAVYRLHSKSGQLLYVGISDKPARRFAEHRDDSRKPWCREEGHPDNQVDWPRAAANIYWYRDEATARKVEERAIKDELPIYNTVHNQRNPLFRAMRGRSSVDVPELEQQTSLEELEAMLADEASEPDGIVDAVETPETLVEPPEVETLPTEPVETPEPAPQPPQAPPTAKATRPTRKRAQRRPTARPSLPSIVHNDWHGGE
jgi:hypothetical protein